MTQRGKLYEVRMDLLFEFRAYSKSDYRRQGEVVAAAARATVSRKIPHRGGPQFAFQALCREYEVHPNVDFWGPDYMLCDAELPLELRNGRQLLKYPDIVYLSFDSRAVGVFLDRFRFPLLEYPMNIRVCAAMASNQVIAGAAKVGNERLFGKEAAEVGKMKHKPNRLKQLDMVWDLLDGHLSRDSRDAAVFLSRFRFPIFECAATASNQVIAPAANIGKISLLGKE